MAELLLEAHGLHSFYGVSHILHGVDFTVARGECIGLMGRNGMGKTTLIKSMLGLVRPKQGAVRVRGKEMTHAAPHAIARAGIAYVPEGRGIFPNLTVRENLVMTARAGVQALLDAPLRLAIARRIPTTTVGQVFRGCALAIRNFDAATETLTGPQPQSHDLAQHFALVQGFLASVQPILHEADEAEAALQEAYREALQ